MGAWLGRMHYIVEDSGKIGRLTLGSGEFQTPNTDELNFGRVLQQGGVIAKVLTKGEKSYQVRGRNWSSLRITTLSPDWARTNKPRR
jgi:hypothetical protein